MSETKTYKATKSAYIYANQPNYNRTITETDADIRGLEAGTTDLLMGFNSEDDAYKYREIINARIKLEWGTYGTETIPITNAGLYINNSDFDEESVTWNSAPGYGENTLAIGTFKSSPTPWVVWVYPIDGVAEITRKDLADLIKFGIRTSITLPEGMAFYTQFSRAFFPYISIIYGEAVTPVVNGSPSSGYIPKGQANTFSWTLEPSAPCVGDFEQASAVLYWKTSASGTEHTVNVGTSQSVTIPANTFSTDTIMWRVKVTTTAGDETYSDWYTLTTVEATSTATALTPKNTMVNGSVQNVFTWEHIIETGSAQTAAQIQISANGTTWSDLLTVSGPQTRADILAGMLTSGQKYWRVRTANSNAVYGSWSSAAPFVVVAAPAKPSVSATQVPKSRISWQGSDQQGYQIQITGVYDSGTVYGTETTRKLPVILPDGQYTVKVRLVNNYGLWSDWGTAALVVVNTPGDAITLTATAGEEAFLSWETTGSYDGFVVYRDGVAVEKTTRNDYTDDLSVGYHKYFVRGIWDDTDYYTQSDTVSLQISVSEKILIDLETKQKIRLKYTSESLPNVTMNRQQKMSMLQLSGDTYPSAEVSPYRTSGMTFSVAFAALTDAEQFEKELGKVVCIKTPKGDAVTGILNAYQKTANKFFVGYRCTIQQLELSGSVEL